MSMLVYLIQVNLALLFFWALYLAAFRKLSFFQWNRFFLLGSITFSFFLPLFRLQWNKPISAVADFEGINWTFVDQLATSDTGMAVQANSWVPGSVLLLVYVTVSLILLVRSALRLRKLYISVGDSRQIRRGRIKVYIQDQQMGSFTLFRRIYLDQSVCDMRLRPVLRHEMVHAAQLHSLDLLFMEFVVAMLWFNPFVYVLKSYIRENHEYLADHSARASPGSLIEYLECLKADTVRTFSPLPVSCFKNSTIKKRIIMLTNNKTKNRKKLRYLGILPAAALMIVLFHTPADRGIAIPLMAEVTGDGLPSLFPLPEEYKDAITWGYKQEAIHPVSKKITTHNGIDVAAPTGTAVFAAGDGVVSKAGDETGWGKMLVIEHQDGYSTYYAHLDKIGVEAGAMVHGGDAIGQVGNTGQSTGSHLHFEVRKNGEHLNPADFY